MESACISVDIKRYFVAFIIVFCSYIPFSYSSGLQNSGIEYAVLGDATVQQSGTVRIIQGSNDMEYQAEDYNFGSSALLTLHQARRVGRPSFEAFLRFSESTIKAENAALSLSLSFRSVSANTQLIIEEVANNWQEDTITWNNRPLPEAGAVQVTQALNRGRAYIRVDLTPFIADGSFSGAVRLRLSTSAYAEISARQSSHGAVLSLRNTVSRVGMAATEDAYTRSGSLANRVFNNHHLIVKNDTVNPIYNRQAYIKFPALTSSLLTHSRALLVLNVEHVYYGARLTIEEVPVSWMQNRITAANAPAPSNSLQVHQFLPAYLSGQQITVDISHLLSDGQFSGALRLSLDGPAFVIFSSIEAGLAPRLEIRTSENPLQPAVERKDWRYVNADSYVRRGSADTNFGNSWRMIVKQHSGSFQRYGYVRFSLTGVNADDLSGAKLRLYKFSSYRDVGISLRRARNDWQENTISWNLQPALFSTATGDDSANSVYQLIQGHQRGRWQEFDVSDLIHAGETELTLRIESDNSDFTVFGTKELWRQLFRAHLELRYPSP